MSIVTLRPSHAVIFERLLVTEVNVDRLRELAGHLRSACRQLREHASLGVGGFLSDTKTTNRASTYSSWHVKRHWSISIGEWTIEKCFGS